MAFKTKPYDAPRKPQTEAQEAATQRSFRIFRLRGLWSQAWLLTGDNRVTAQAAIDAELVSLGAVPESVRYAERIQGWDRPTTIKSADAELDVLLPF